MKSAMIIGVAIGLISVSMAKAKAANTDICYYDTEKKQDICLTPVDDPGPGPVTHGPGNNLTAWSRAAQPVAPIPYTYLSDVDAQMDAGLSTKHHAFKKAKPALGAGAAEAGQTAAGAR
jgi:hypothetical protein